MKKSIAILMSFLILLVSFSLQGLAEETDNTRAYIEYTLNLANNAEQEWTFSAENDAWTLSIVSTVAYPELPDQQGVSVCVPGAYVKGIDTDKDGVVDITSPEAQEGIKGGVDH